MTDPTPRRRVTGRALMAGALLALPLTASMSYAAAEDVPLPPPPPVAPEAPAAGEQHRIVIVEKHGGARPDDPALKTRVIQRDGKTVVFKTDQDLTDAEIEQKVDLALRSIPEPPEPPLPPEAPEPPAAPEAPGKVHRYVFRSGHGSQVIEVPDAAELSAQVDAEVARGMAEAQRGLAEARRGLAEADAGRVEALAAIREARNDVAGDESVPDDIRKRVLKQLDREIERLSRPNKS